MEPTTLANCSGGCIRLAMRIGLGILYTLYLSSTFVSISVDVAVLTCQSISVSISVSTSMSHHCTIPISLWVPMPVYTYVNV